MADRTTEQRFWSKVDATGDCWLWMSRDNGVGYGCFDIYTNGVRKTHRAHRLAYEL